MEKIIKPYRVELDIYTGSKDQMHTIIKASDNTKRFEIKLTAEGEKYPLDDLSIKAAFRRSDRVKVEYDVTEIDLETSTIILPIKELVYLGGQVVVEVMIKNQEGEYITFPPFTFLAKENEYTKNITKGAFNYGKHS